MPIVFRPAVPALLAALTVLAAPQDGRAQEAGFAVTLSPAVDGFSEVQVRVRQFGTADDPATSYVRGCRGHVVAEGAAALFELSARFDPLVFSAHGEGLVSLVVETPDGLYRCAHVEAGATAVAQIADAPPGRYRVWASAVEGASVDVQIIAAERPVTGIELTGLDLAALGAPRAGRHRFTGTEEAGRQILVAGGRLYAEEPMRPLNPAYCPGFSRLDAADAVLVLEAPERELSVFAMSERDLTLAVAAPDGRVLCEDDTFGLNPAVSFDDAPEGDYHVFVGAFGEGRGAELYDLYAIAGAPQFGAPGTGPLGAPRAGHVMHDPRQAPRGQHLATAPVVASDPVEDLVPGQFCAGYVSADAPDAILSVEDPAEALSIYAVSPTDLVIAVRGPEGDWLCDDDTYGINPAVTFENPLPGEYQIHVGAFAQYAEAIFALFASDGAPNWELAASPAPEALNVDADPAVARLSFGPRTRPDPRVVFDVPRTDFAIFELGEECAGYIDPTRPDMVIAAEDGLPQLMIYMIAEGDGTLAVVGPDGTLYCNDDFEGLHPGILIPNPEAGDYAVFAGTFDGSGGLATLSVTVSTPIWTMDREG